MDSTDSMNLNSSNHIAQSMNSSSNNTSPNQMWQNNYTNISDELHLPATDYSEVDLLTQQISSMNAGGGEASNATGNDGHSNVSLLDMNYYYFPPPYSYSMHYFPYSTRRTSSQASYNRSNNLPKVAKSALYKTELCKNFNNTGYCRYGDMCQFAHGSEQLRKVNKNHQNNVNELDASSSTTTTAAANPLTTNTGTLDNNDSITNTTTSGTTTTNNNNNNNISTGSNRTTTGNNQNNSEYRSNYHPRQYNNNNNRLTYSNFQNNNNSNGNNRNHRHYNNNYNNNNQMGYNNRKYTTQNVISDTINDWPPLPPPTNPDNNGNNNNVSNTTTNTTATTATATVPVTPTAWINKPLN